MARIYQDSAGTTPVTTYDQPVGLIQRAAGTVDAVQSTGAARPTMARWPKGGMFNGLRNTEDASKWSSPGGVTDENGVTTVGGVPDNGPSQQLDREYPSGTGIYGPDAVTYRCIEVKPLDNMRYFSWSHQTQLEWIDLSTGEMIGPQQDSSIFRRGTLLEDGWVRYERAIPAINNGRLRSIIYFGEEEPVLEASNNTPSPNPGGSRLLIRKPIYQFIEGWEGEWQFHPYQRVGETRNDVTEEGVPSIYHLYNDGGDSINATLPNSTYGRAWVDPYGEAHFDTVTGTEVNAAPAERTVDSIIREGAFTPAEQDRLRDYWEGLYK